MFGGIGMTELLVILGIVILIFGAKRLPEIGSGIGKGIRNFKSSISKDPLEEIESKEQPREQIENTPPKAE